MSLEFQTFLLQYAGRNGMWRAIFVSFCFAKNCYFAFAFLVSVPTTHPMKKEVFTAPIEAVTTTGWDCRAKERDLSDTLMGAPLGMEGLRCKIINKNVRRE